jgi:Variant SH3 domain
MGWCHAGKRLTASYLQPILPAIFTQGNGAKGLKFSKGEIVMVGRIVNGEWYQGFKDENTCGYFPHVLVQVQ